MPETVAIIGAGPLGRWLALSAARAGFRVLLEDVMPANLHHAQEFLRQQLGAEARGADAQVAFVSTIEDAVREADLAIDCVPDELESKLEIFSLLDRMAPPRTVLCTPTLALSVTDLASCTYRPERCVGLRAAGADLLSGAVDVVRSRFLVDPVEAAVVEFLVALGLSVVVIEDELEPMLVKNALLGPR